MSKTVAVYPIVAALAKAYVVGQALTPWKPVNQEQQRFLEHAAQWEKELSALSEKELEVTASYSADEINAWLKERGFNITLKPFTDPDAFGTAAVMKVLVKWLTPGKEVYLTKDNMVCERHGDDLYTSNGERIAYSADNCWSAAKLEEDVTYSTIEGHAHPIAHIHTETGDTVHITLADKTDLEGLDLLAKVMWISTQEEKRSFGFDSVVFPKVDHNAEVDISFLKKMQYRGRRASTGDVDTFYVEEAKQQTVFQMDHLGAKAESAVAISMGLECMHYPKPDMIVNGTFYVWMTRKGMTAPYFAGCIDSSDWKDPGTIDEKSRGEAQMLPEEESKSVGVEEILAEMDEMTEAYVPRAPRGRLEVL